MIRAVIIDDIEQARITFRKDLEVYAPDIEVVGEASGVVEGAKLLKHTKIDILFLDIQMPKMSGNGKLTYPIPRVGGIPMSAECPLPPKPSACIIWKGGNPCIFFSDYNLWKWKHATMCGNTTINYGWLIGESG